ncbi:MAG: hypothetical protein JOS17DRAFT_756235 [Linnemannia elongata]|nr:MAG: hypothetical protein JOS17DRAFT_756235 [Linnemannia elongata]
MLRSAASFIVLSLVAIQAAVASTITPGTYLIQDVQSHLFLSILPAPPGLPLAPVVLVPNPEAIGTLWTVEKGVGNGILISARSGGPDDYQMTHSGKEVIVSIHKTPETSWHTEEVGGGPDVVTINLSNDDNFITSNEHARPQVTLQDSYGAGNQYFRFIRIKRSLYHRTHFTIQDSC